ncbi:MAG: restriction endonuclease subunit S [Myxococcales bacterium]|nr:restriction endonuclease subunit S [Myxococcales bacterium]
MCTGAPALTAQPVALAAVLDVASGQVDPRERPYCDLLHVGGDNIESDTGRLFGLRKAGELNLISGKYAFGPEDVLYSKIRPALNKVALPDFAGICSADMYPLRPRPGLLERRYLAYLLRHHDFLTFALKHSSRTNIPKINRDALLTYRVSLPPVPEQRRIADILDKADAIRRKRKQAMALTEDLLRSAFLDMFGDPVTNPKGWESVAIEDIASSDRHALAIGPFGSNLLASDYAGTGHPVIFVRDLVTGLFDWKSRVYVSHAKFAELAAHHARPGDVLVTKMGDPPGTACVLPEGFPPAVVTADVVKVSVDRQRVHPEYLAAALNSSCGRFQVARITAGVTRGKITLRDFRLVRVRLPPLPNQLRFVAFVTRVGRLRGGIAGSVRVSDSLFAALVDLAFRSEISVTNRPRPGVFVSGDR